MYGPVPARLNACCIASVLVDISMSHEHVVEASFSQAWILSWWFRGTLHLSAQHSTAVHIMLSFMQLIRASHEEVLAPKWIQAFFASLPQCSCATARRATKLTLHK